MIKRHYFELEAARIARYEEAIASQFTLHVACSDLDRQRLKVTMPTASVVSIPNGVDTTYFLPVGRRQRPNSLIFVGTLNWYPNNDAVTFILNDIWPALRSRVPDATLDIVGAGASRALMGLAARSPGATLHGYLPDVRLLLETASLYICPIRDGGGTKLKILDALSMGKCIIAHPIACEGIAVTPDSNVEFAESPSEFVTLIEGLLGNEERRTRIGRAARLLAVEKYSFEAIGEELVAVLHHVARDAKLHEK